MYSIAGSKFGFWLRFQPKVLATLGFGIGPKPNSGPSPNHLEHHLLIHLFNYQLFVRIGQGEVVQPTSAPILYQLV